MYINESRVRRLSESIVRTLVKQGYVRLQEGREELTERINAFILDNLRAEQALEEEAERLAEKHARQMVGMDQRKIIQGIKERLAKERGFQL